MNTSARMYTLIHLMRFSYSDHSVARESWLPELLGDDDFVHS